LQLALRAWVLENLTTMVNNPRNSLWGVFNVLQRTWAVDQLALRAQAVSAGMVERAAVPARDSARAVPVGAAPARPAPAPKPKPPDKWCDEALEYYGFRNVLTLPKHLSEPEAWQQSLEREAPASHSSVPIGHEVARQSLALQDAAVHPPASPNAPPDPRPL